MIRRISAAPLLAALVAFHLLSLVNAGNARRELPSGTVVELLVPSPVLKVTSLEFKGLTSDLLFISALVFEGGTYVRGKVPRMQFEEWQWFYRTLEAATDLDPYFLDPYLLANAHMVWEAGMIRETNELLEKGTRSRDWDWLIPFLGGFNYFYFLQNNVKAVELLVTASQRPGPSEQLLSLASRLMYKEKKTENALVFLESLARRTEDKRLKKDYETRIRAFQARLVLERSVAAFRQQFRHFPHSLHQMVESGVLKEIPQDPYGGTFSIGAQGEVKSTTDHLLLPQQRK